MASNAVSLASLKEQAPVLMQAAIQAYQQMAGLPVDGKPSEALLEDLRSVVADQTKPQSQPAGN